MASSILLTGAHRSGTTWVGKMLTLDASREYVYEPFNVNNASVFSSLGMERWFEYVPGWPDNCRARVEAELRRIFALRYPFRRALRDADGWLGRARAVRVYGRSLLHQWQGRQTVVKDPIAVFSAEWIARRLDAQVIVLVRHPAAFAESLQRKQWSHPFDHFLEQPALMDDHLAPFADQIRAMANCPPDVLDQASLLWTLIYSVVHTYWQRNDGWILLRHEDLARRPVAAFKKLYDRLGMAFTPEIRAQVETHSEATNATSSNRVDHIRRDSQSVIHRWKDSLSTSEIHRIESRTRPLADTFYDPDEWQIP